MIVFNIPLLVPFRGVTRRQGILFEGEADWAEWSPFREYGLSTPWRCQRYGRNEIKTVRVVDVPELRQRTDAAARELRELDMKIQSLNWAVELIEA